MEITGKIIVALPEQSGVSKAGNSWKKKEYVLETQETYPKKVHFDLFGDKADKYPLTVGQTIRLSFDIESREYNGRWFTSIRGWQAEPVDASVWRTCRSSRAPTSSHAAFRSQRGSTFLIRNSPRRCVTQDTPPCDFNPIGRIRPS